MTIDLIEVREKIEKAIKRKENLQIKAKLLKVK